MTRKEGIPVTSPARTLLDLAATVSARDLNRAADEARVHRLVTDHSLNGQFQRYPHHRGPAALTKAIQTEPALTRSEDFLWRERLTAEGIRIIRPTWRQITEEREPVVAILAAAGLAAGTAAALEDPQRALEECYHR